MTAQTYDQKLHALSVASVDRHFDAFLDVPWDEHDLDPRDPRWALPATDPLGAHPWYQALPLDQQVRIGLWRQAAVTKVGLQFENLLMRGALDYVYGLPNGSAEFRYLTHEVTEETHHTQMFQEFVNRTGLPVRGMPRVVDRVQRLIPMLASLCPELFFVMVLGGEEPIDHVQKAVLRSGTEVHPLLLQIMRIHVAEEARHISFAHEHLRRTVPELSRTGRVLLSLATPVLMRVMCDLIMRPGPGFAARFGVPPEVMREAYWEAPASRRLLRDIFGDVRALAEETGLMNPLSRRLWKALGIAGPASRYRSAPASLAG